MRILHFADLHLGVESYGHNDPATGLSTRLQDILKSLDQLVDYAVENDIDLVLFCGDAYKSREPSQTHQRELARRINRLSAAGIPVFLLIGNHDLPNALGRATSTEIFSTLSVRNVYVSSRPDVYSIPTKSGVVQVATLPWLKRSTFLIREETKNLSFEQINERMQATLINQIDTHISKLDSSLPAVLAAHVWVGAVETGGRKPREGTEKQMTIGQEHTLALSSVARLSFDYVALGHIHVAQVLREDNPPVVYSGSLDRLDFGDEGLEKGFYVVDIEPGTQANRRLVSYQFHPVDARRFLTIDINLMLDDSDPMQTVRQAIEQKADEVRDAIVRVHLSLPAGMEKMLNEAEIKSLLKPAYFSNIAYQIIREARVRMGGIAVEGMVPLDALKMWLETKNTPPEHAEIVLEYGKRLIDGDPQS